MRTSFIGQNMHNLQALLASAIILASDSDQIWFRPLKARETPSYTLAFFSFEKIFIRKFKRLK